MPAKFTPRSSNWNLFIETDNDKIKIVERDNDGNELSSSDITKEALSLLRIQIEKAIVAFVEQCEKEDHMVYIVEYWSNSMPVCSPDGPARDTNWCHIASDKDSALEWCVLNNDYAGKEDNWHWAITRVRVDSETGYESMPEHFTRDGRECNCDGRVTAPNLEWNDGEEPESDEEPLKEYDGSTKSVWEEKYEAQECDDCDELIEDCQCQDEEDLEDPVSDNYDWCPACKKPEPATLDTLQATLNKILERLNRL